MTIDIIAAARQVLQLRYWQHLLNEDLKQKRFRVPVHLAMGHEALAVAVSAAMSESDQMALTHRNVAYNLARAGSLGPVRLEYESSAAGAAAGMLGSMNLIHPRHGVVYTSSILGNNLPVACGLAMARVTAGERSVVFALTGDGAMEEGAFYESLVFARSHDLPVVFVVENNDHSLASKIAERRCAIRIPALCDAMGIQYTLLTGNHTGEYCATLSAVRRYAFESGPVCVEAMITTFTNHAGATPGWATDPKQISLEDGLVLEESPRDPVWVARQILDPADYEMTAGYLVRLGRGVAGSETRREDTCPAI